MHQPVLSLAAYRDENEAVLLNTKMASIIILWILCSYGAPLILALVLCFLSGREIWAERRRRARRRRRQVRRNPRLQANVILIRFFFQRAKEQQRRNKQQQRRRSSSRGQTGGEDPR